MKIRFPLGTLLVALSAAVALASPAMAKGGGGGGGGVITALCATIQSWTNGVVQMLNGPSVAMTIGVFNGCLDEGGGAGRLPALTMTYTDTATGAWQGAATYNPNYGLNYYTFYAGAPVPADQAAPVTLTVTLLNWNGKLMDSRSMTTAEVMQSVQSSVQPAA